MYFLAFERPFAYSHSIEIIQSIPDPSCKYKSFELTDRGREGEGGGRGRGGGETKEKNSNNNNVNDVLCPEGEDPLAASGAAAVRILSVIPTIQL